MKRRLLKGTIQVYTGPGKGKTTAAIGLAVRAAGAGLRVYMQQFIKRSDYSELRALSKIRNIIIEQCGRGCFVKGRPKKKDIEYALHGLDRAHEKMLSGRFDVIILDEFNIALNAGLIRKKDAQAFIDDKPARVELVLTGRGCPSCIMKRADLVTEMASVRHHFDNGIAARRGIEY